MKQVSGSGFWVLGSWMMGKDMADPLIINISIPSLSQIAVMPDAVVISTHLRSAVAEQVKLALYVKALTERLAELYATP